MQSKQKKKIFFLIAIFAIAIILLMFPKIKNSIMYRIYQTEYDEFVYKYAIDYNVDPLLVFAIIKAESNFKENVVSTSGAKGLMQLIDSTAQDTARKLQISYTPEDLFNKEKNIMIGTKYFSTLYDKYGNIELALTAYNAGSGNVDKWLEAGIIAKDGSNVENIPFKETNNYVRKTLRDYEIYKELYN